MEKRRIFLGYETRTELGKKLFWRIVYSIAISRTFRLLKMVTWQCIIITSLLVKLLLANQPAEIDQYVCKDNEGKLFTCFYDLQMGKFLELRCVLAFIVLRGDERELFLSYGFDTEKASVLHSS